MLINVLIKSRAEEGREGGTKQAEFSRAGTFVFVSKENRSTGIGFGRENLGVGSEIESASNDFIGENRLEVGRDASTTAYIRTPGKMSAIIDDLFRTF